MLFDITFNKNEGGLGRTLAGDDSVSGFVYGLELQATYNGAQNHVFYSQAEVEAYAAFDDADYDTLKYHTAQYFAMVSAPLWIAIGDRTLIAPMQRAASGKIKQVAFLDDVAFATSSVTALQTIADTLSAEHIGLSILYSASNFGAMTLSTLPDLTTLTAPNVSVTVGKNAGNANADSMLGVTLGTVAASKVSDCIGYVKKFNVVKGTEFDALEFTTGETYTSRTLTELNAVKAKGYVFLRKYTGFSGSFHSDSNTAVASTSDYAFIENNRTMEKATRGIRAALVPELGSPLKLKAGKLAYETVTKFELLTKLNLEAMKNADEISEFSVRIDPDQNVLSTSTLNVEAVIVPMGVARQIVVNIGFALKA